MHRLFEFNDQAWLPTLFRNLMTELMQHQLGTYGIYSAAIPKLNEALERTGSSEVLDLCSGSGGPLLHLLPELRVKRLMLSDRYPNLSLVETAQGIPVVTYLPYPVDARAVPRSLEGCRTMFTGFHHFDPPGARRVLEDAVQARAPIAVFEFTNRAYASLRTALLTALFVLRDSWSVRPRRWSRAFWTYVVPVIPLLYSWDAVVSHWRSYAPTELAALTEDLTSYAWDIGTLPEPPHVTYLIGNPAG